MKTLKAWAVVDSTGSIICVSLDRYPVAEPGHKTVRVEIREVKPAKEKRP